MSADEEMQGSSQNDEQIPQDNDGSEKVGPLTELQLLRWENALLKQERELRNREQLTASTSSVSNVSNGGTNTSTDNFKMGLSEIKTLIDEFNPNSNSILTAKSWIRSIETLKEIYGWDEKTTLFYSTLRLGGAASLWYQAKRSTIKTFPEFKKEILESFPSEQSDATILWKIMEKKRLPGESIENYIYEVVSLGNKINLDESSVIKYIISGLSDQDLKNVLTASKCLKITDLLMQAKTFEEIQRQGHYRGNINEYRREATRKFPFNRNNTKFHPYKENVNHNNFNRQNFNRNPRTFQYKEEKKTEAGNKEVVRCFKCNETGHYARNCNTDGKLRKCFRCNQAGHVAKDCQKKFVSHLSMETDITPRDEYHKMVMIEGKQILAFFDLGSECSTIKEDILKGNQWQMKGSSVKLMGFGGKQTTVIGEITKVVTVCDISKTLHIMVVAKEAQTVPMIIGRNFMDQPDIQIIKSWKSFEITQIENTDITITNKTNKNKLLIGDISFGNNASQVDKSSLLELVNEFRDCFAKDIKELGKTNLIKMKIELKENKIVRYHPYKVAYGLKSVLRNSIDELLKQDIIGTSTSEYASPVLLVAKKNGEYRMCVDYRKLNSITKRETFPVPNIEETINSLANKKIFTTLDLLSGYHQVPIEEGSRHLTAFITPEGQYEFKRVPFGLTNSPAVFMRLMTKVIQPIQRNKIIIYMDDILIPSTTIQENINTLREFLTEIKKAGLTLNIRKCVFFEEKIEFLGHEISAEGIKPGHNKTKAVENYKRPENAREIKQFLGLSGYFRRFIKGFSDIARPLNILLRKDAEFKWDEKAEAAFQHLKDLLSQRPVLALYDENAKHEVHTDASSHGLAGVLMQERGGDLRPVSYFSRATTAAESKYHSYELEALAVVESLERFKHYLLHRKFKVVTDCNSLRQTQEKKNLIPRIARWWLKISEFDFELVFRPASKLSHADALSRCPVEQGKEGEDITSKMLTIGVSNEDWLAVLQEQDPRLVEIRKILNGEVTSHKEKDEVKGNYTLEKGRIFKKTPSGNRFVIPSGVRWKVIKTAHDDRGHPGIDRTLEALKKYVWFPHMKQVVTKYVNACIDCLYNKRGTDEGNYHLYITDIQPIPFHTVHIDHLGPYPKSRSGNMHVIGVIDAFTKYIALKPTRTTKTRAVIRLLEEMTQYLGMPTRIITDRGTAFTSKEFEKFCHENAIKHVLTTVKTPRGNGQIERYFRTTKGAIATMAEDVEGRDWDKNIRSIQWALNSLKNGTTRVTPQELVMTYQPRDILQNKLLLALHDRIETEEEENTPLIDLKEKVLRRIREKQEAQAAKHNIAHKEPKKYNEGDLVLIRHEHPSFGQPRKTLPRYKGPYVVKAVLEKDRYVLTDAEGLQISQKPYESIHAADRMKPWCDLENLNFDEDAEDEDENEQEES